MSPKISQKYPQKYPKKCPLKYYPAMKTGKPKITGTAIRRDLIMAHSQYNIQLHTLIAFYGF